MLALLQLPHILPDTGSSDTSVALGSHVVSEGHDDLLDLLGQLPGGGQDQSLKNYKGFRDSGRYFIKLYTRRTMSNSRYPLNLCTSNTDQVIYHIIDQIKV